MGRDEGEVEVCESGDERRCVCIGLVERLLQRWLRWFSGGRGETREVRVVLLRLEVKLVLELRLRVRLNGRREEMRREGSGSVVLR